MSDGWLDSISSFQRWQLGVALVHPEQVAGPEVGLVAALGAADLDDHVLAVVGVPRDEQLLEVLLELGEPGLLLGDLRRRYSRISGSLSPAAISRASARSASAVRYSR